MKRPRRLRGTTTWLVWVLLLVPAHQFLLASSEAITTAAQPRDKFSIELKQDIDGILQQAELQQKSRITLQLRFDYCEKHWSSLERQFVTPPQDTLGEATLDIEDRANDEETKRLIFRPKVRFRVDFKPIVERWTDGSRPYDIEDENAITDGEQSWGSYPAKGAGDLGYMLGYRYRADSQLQFAIKSFSNPDKQPNAPPYLYDVQRITSKGRTVVRVQDIIKTGYGTQRRTWWLDPKRNYALFQYDWAAFNGGSSQPATDDFTSVGELQEIAPELWYPTQFSTEVSSYKNGKMEDSSFRATTKLTHLTILSKVDGRLFQP